MQRLFMNKMLQKL